MTQTLSLLPISETFALQYEPIKGASFTVLQGRVGEDTDMSDRFNKRNQYWVKNEDGTFRSVEEYSTSDLARWRYMAFCSISAFDVNDPEGKPLFTFVRQDGYDRLVDYEAFVKVWNRLPIALANEMLDFIWKVNPHWHPLYQSGAIINAPEKTEGESNATSDSSENE